MRFPLLIAIVVGFSGVRICVGENREFDLKTTQRLGNELVRASKRSDRGFTTPAKKRAKETAKAAVRDRLYDQVRYDYVVLDDPAGGGLLVYALAHAKKKGAITTGGHYRVSVSADGATARRVDLLAQLIDQSKPPAGKELAALVASQLEGTRPFETWVYSSDVYRIPMYVVVVSNRSEWAIANGHIVEIDEKRPKAHLKILNQKAPE